MAKEREKVHVSCNLCGCDHPEPLFAKDGFRHVRCTECGLIYVTPRLSNHVEQQEIFWDKEMGLDGIEAAAARDYRKSRRKKLLSEARAYREYRNTGHIMDIGCGFGAFLKAVRELGWEHPEGVEIAPQAISYTSRYFPVKTDITEENPLKKGLFDVIRLNNVIEHLPDPRKIVRSVHELLRPGGLIVVATPNYDSLSVALCGSRWQYIGGEDHIYLFTPQTLRRLLEKEGFRIVDIKTKGVHVSPNDRTVRRKTILPALCRKTAINFERLLNLLIRHTHRGHRLKILAEKV
jgi:2-polyprenyl-3-methyl-5-hydroxy-6-metoxy-1,4-benzoquinol methylase